ncbi:hypothetical protein DMI65_08645 [Escherichia coli]|nr:hypothetical protein [Escherichia coli]
MYGGQCIHQKRSSYEMVTWRCSFRSHNLKISTFLKNAHKSYILFSYCDQNNKLITNNVRDKNWVERK